MGQVFEKLLTVEGVLVQMNNRACFWKSLAMDVLTSPKNSWNLQKSTFILLFHHFHEHWARKKFILIRSDILRQLDNKYTGNYVYSGSNRESLPLPI